VFPASLPAALKATLKVRALGFLKIPMLFFVSPTVVELTETRCVVRVPFVRRNRNHLGSLYFGALAVGADCAGGLIAWRLIEESGKPIQLIFKDFHAEFLKRAEGDLHVTCDQGREIAALVAKAAETGERQNLSVRMIATTPRQSGDEPVARFVLTLSLKRK
jgi:acyl-coenzyme A thioesterase PaaI-like protein